MSGTGRLSTGVSLRLNLNVTAGFNLKFATCTGTLRLPVPLSVPVALVVCSGSVRVTGTSNLKQLSPTRSPPASLSHRRRRRDRPRSGLEPEWPGAAAATDRDSARAMPLAVRRRTRCHWQCSVPPASQAVPGPLRRKKRPGSAHGQDKPECHGLVLEGSSLR